MYPEDIPNVMDIERQSFSVPWSEASFQNELYNRYSITMVAEVKGTIVGYICVNQVADECHLLNLAVHPDYRRKGIATMLLENVICELKMYGCRFFYLEVRMSGFAAKKLYVNAGFRTVGIRKDYYTNPADDAVIMMMEL